MLDISSLYIKVTFVDTSHMAVHPRMLSKQLKLLSGGVVFNGRTQGLALCL